MFRSMITVAAAVSLTACVTQYSFTPVAGAGQEVRYQHGAPTTLSNHEKGSVQVTPLQVNASRRLVFGVAAFNKSDQPAAFGIENLSVATSDGTPVTLFTADQLVKEAKNQAIVQAFAIALTGVAAAYAANQNAYSTTNGYVASRYGVTTFSATTFNVGDAAAGTALAATGTAYGLVAVKNSLDQTIAGVRGHVLQTTTVDPGSSYGAEVVVDRLKNNTAYPQEVTLAVRWNDEEHRFRFVVDKAK